jgi:uncharacterized protein
MHSTAALHFNGTFLNRFRSFAKPVAKPTHSQKGGKNWAMVWGVTEINDPNCVDKWLMGDAKGSTMEKSELAAEKHLPPFPRQEKEEYCENNPTVKENMMLSSLFSRLGSGFQPIIAATTLSALLLNPLGMATALAQEEPLNILTVTGRGVETISTSISQVSLGVEVQGKTAQEVQQEVARRSTAVVALLRSRKVEKLETTGISLSPNYSYINNRQQLIGYMGSNTVSFRIATEQTGTLLDDAVKAGASQINGVSFIASPTLMATAKNQALKEAVQDAQSQAKAVLDTLNLSPKQVIRIQIDNTSLPIPRPMLMKTTNAADASTPVLGGEQQVEASVTLQIRY